MWRFGFEVERQMGFVEYKVLNIIYHFVLLFCIIISSQDWSFFFLLFTVRDSESEHVIKSYSCLRSICTWVCVDWTSAFVLGRTSLWDIYKSVPTSVILNMLFITWGLKLRVSHEIFSRWWGSFLCPIYHCDSTKIFFGLLDQIGNCFCRVSGCNELCRLWFQVIKLELRCKSCSKGFILCWSDHSSSCVEDLTWGFKILYIVSNLIGTRVFLCVCSLDETLVVYHASVCIESI